jgi:hypothetical protein
MIKLDKMINKKIIIALFLVFRLSDALCAQTMIKAEVDKQALTTDEFLSYKITFTCAQKNLPLPKIPGFTGFRVISKSQSSNVSIGKDGLAATISYIFLLSPVEPGKLIIEPAEVKLNNKTYSTQSFEIEVAMGKEKPKALPAIPYSESQEPQYTL